MGELFVIAFLIGLLGLLLLWNLQRQINALLKRIRDLERQQLRSEATELVAVSHSLYKEFPRTGRQKLWAPIADGEGMDWVRPYDLRHAYAIRCATSVETAEAFDDDMATWMGHGVDVHRRIYLRWLSSSRRKEALQRRRGQGVAVNAIQPHTAPVALPDDITPDLLEMARKLKAAGLVSTSAG